jgi:hypothetical protein
MYLLKWSQENNSIRSLPQIKCLSKNLTNDAENLYNKNYEALRKESAEGVRWKALSCSRISRMNIMKMSILSKMITYSIQYPLNSKDTIYRNRKINKKCIWKEKRPQVTKPILSKKSNTTDIIIPAFKLYYRCIGA